VCFIDEAVTPLIISRAEENKPLMEACRNAYRIACTLDFGTDYQKISSIGKSTYKQGEKRWKAVESDCRDCGGARRGVQNSCSRLSTAREFTQGQGVRDSGRKVTIVMSLQPLMPNRTWRHAAPAVEAKKKHEVNKPQ